MSFLTEYKRSTLSNIYIFYFTIYRTIVLQEMFLIYTIWTNKIIVSNNKYKIVQTYQILICFRLEFPLYLQNTVNLV